EYTDNNGEVRFDIPEPLPTKVKVIIEASGYEHYEEDLQTKLVMGQLTHEIRLRAKSDTPTTPDKQPPGQRRTQIDPPARGDGGPGGDKDKKVSTAPPSTGGAPVPGTSVPKPPAGVVQMPPPPPSPKPQGTNSSPEKCVTN